MASAGNQRCAVRLQLLRQAEPGPPSPPNSLALQQHKQFHSWDSEFEAMEPDPILPTTTTTRCSANWKRLKTLSRALTPKEWRRVAAMAAVILALHAVGFFILLALVVPRHFKGGLGLGVGITAYTLGMRHAFDADHIAAIDNTTRKLMTEGKRPLGVGFFFSLGHSTVVFGLAFLLAIGVRSLSGAVEDDHSNLHRITGLVGTSVSGSFLYLIAAINLVTLVSLVRVFRRMRKGRLDERELEDVLTNRGLANRCYARATRAVRRSWHMYPLGVLFGFGFDTATEITLLVLAAGAGLAGVPWYAILCLPLLFASGMSLLDTIDGAFMNFAYGWALSKPVRKLFYNIVITALSVCVAFLVGTIELVAILADKLSIHGRFWRWVANLDLNLVGYAIVGLFVVTWAVALLVWHFGWIEERWGAQITTVRTDAAPEPVPQGERPVEALKGAASAHSVEAGKDSSQPDKDSSQPDKDSSQPDKDSAQAVGTVLAPG